MRAITKALVHDVVQSIPTGVLTGEALDDAVDEISGGIQEARTVERPYVVLDPRPERGYKEVNPDVLVQDAAVAYTEATSTLKEANAKLKAAIGVLPMQLKEHEVAVSDWMGTEITSRKLNLVGGGSACVYLRKKQSKRKPRVTVPMLKEIIRKALRCARRNPESVRRVLVTELERRVGAIECVVSTRVTLDRGGSKA